MRRPAVVLAQEARLDMINDLVGGGTDDFDDDEAPYLYVGECRDGDGNGELCPVFYDSEILEHHGSGTIWLSESPSEKGSLSWDAKCPRVATWAWLRRRGKADSPTMAFVSTHFDHVGVEARRQS